MVLTHLQDSIFFQIVLSILNTEKLFDQEHFAVLIDTYIVSTNCFTRDMECYKKPFTGTRMRLVLILVFYIP